MESPRQKAVEIINFDISKPIDIETASMGLGPYGVENFYNMIPYFESMTLTYSMTELAGAYDTYNARRFAQFASNLKDGCYHIGAGQMFYICWLIEKEYN